MGIRHWNWVVLLTAVFIHLGCFTPLTSAQTLNETLIAEDPVKLAEAARQYGDIVRGAILFHQGNINCAKCHRPAYEEDRIGPDLSRMDRDVSDAFIIESILQPSKQIKQGFETTVALTVDGETISGIKVREDENQVVIRDSANIDNLVRIAREDIEQIKVGTVSSMPADLANQLKNRQQFLDLLRYVIDIWERGPESANKVAQTTMRKQLSPELEGLALIQKLNCIACHPLESLNAPVSAKQPPRLTWSAQRLNPNYIRSFLTNPHGTKPGTSMPSMLDHLEEPEREKVATAITHYLLSKKPNVFAVQPTDTEASSRGYETFNSVGCAACHHPRDRAAEEQELEDSYPLGDLNRKYNLDALVEFLKDPLSVRASGHMPNMQLLHREAVDLSNFLLQSPPQAVEKWSVDSALAAKGKTYFEQHRCINCHTDFAQSQTDIPVFELTATGRGCLSEDKGHWPDFKFSEGERKAILAALRNPASQLSAQQQIEVTLTSFNCTACHQRDDLGGVTSERNPHFKTTNLNLGDQGRIPPTLTGVGAKLKPKWLRDVMVNGRSIRPYMKTRMPQFGEENIKHLFELLPNTDRLDATKFAIFSDQKAMRQRGHQLAGNQGLNCVACHTYQYKTSDTMPAVDLTEMAERLEKDWFYQYMLAPQTFSPNTVMPSFWPNGKAIRSDLEGTPEEQVEALWQYLIDGRQARPPRGVVREPLEIIVTDEAQMLRRKYPGIGKRGIGVGYPGNVNLSFDAEQMRLASIWRGKFVEASGVWRGQGSGNVRPMNRTIDFPKGPDLDFANQPWVVDEARPPNHQFKGYRLDKIQRPTFLYEIDNVQVEDFFESTKGNDNQTYLRRSIRLVSTKPDTKLRMRLAIAPTIEEANGAYSVDGKLTIKILSEHDARIVTFKDQRQLEVPLNGSPNETRPLQIEYRW